MTTTILLALAWVLVAIAAWIASRPTAEERETLAGARMGEILFSFGDARRRHHWTLDDERIVRALRRRSAGAAFLAVVFLAIVALSLLRDQGPTGSEADTAVRTEAPVRAEGQEAKPEPERQLVRTYLRSADGKGPPQVVEEYRVETLEEKRDPIRLYGTAKVAAKYDNMKLLGITITNIQPGSFWEMVGFRDGDFILEANGELMDNPNTSVAFMNSMHDAPEVIVRVRGKDDVERTLVYNAPRD